MIDIRRSLVNQISRINCRVAPKCLDDTYPFIDLGSGKRRVSMAINEGTKPDYNWSSKSLSKPYSYLVAVVVDY